MAINKVEFGDRTLIDLTADSVTPQTMLKGTTAHNAAGEPIEGAVVTAPLSDVTPSAPTEAGSAGTAEKASRSDHQHPKEVFIVNFTTGENDAVSADKTPLEVYTAWAAGKIVIGVIDGTQMISLLYSYGSADEGYATFGMVIQSAVGTNSIQVYGSTNNAPTWEYTESSQSFTGIPHVLTLTTNGDGALIIENGLDEANLSEVIGWMREGTPVYLNQYTNAADFEYTAVFYDHELYTVYFSLFKDGTLYTVAWNGATVTQAQKSVLMNTGGAILDKYLKTKADGTVEGVDLPTASTAAAGITTLSSDYISAQEDRAATPKAVNAVYEIADGKQGKIAVAGILQGDGSGGVSAAETVEAEELTVSTETWVFTLEDGSTVTKTVLIAG